MANLKESLRELFPTTDPEKAARSRSGARLVKARQKEPELSDPDYLPVLALILGAAILGIALLRPTLPVNAGVPRGLNPREENYPPENYQMQDESSPIPYLQ